MARLTAAQKAEIIEKKSADVMRRADERTDWKAVARDRTTEVDNLTEALDRQTAVTMRGHELLTQAQNERDKWHALATDTARQRDDATIERREAERMMAVQARRADFWKGVAMGFDPVRATAIEERQNASRNPQGESGKLMDVLRDSYK